MKPVAVLKKAVKVVKDTLDNTPSYGMPLQRSPNNTMMITEKA